jgi:hypothetical protein
MISSSLLCGAARRNGVGLCWAATWQGIFGQMARQWCIPALVVNTIRGCFFESPWTPELCLKKSIADVACQIMVYEKYASAG